MKGLLSEEEELRRFNAAQGGEQPWYAKALPMEGRATILPFRDTMPGSVFNKREFALPGLLAEAVNAFTSPARALLGTDADFYPEKEAANMALNFMGGGLLSNKAAPKESGGVNIGMFAGDNPASSQSMKQMQDEYYATVSKLNEIYPKLRSNSQDPTLINQYKDLDARKSELSSIIFKPDEAIVAPKVSETYQGEHQAPMKDSGSPLWNLSGIYPDDFYSSVGAKYYGDGADYARDFSIVSQMQSFKGRPDRPVTIYRAVPKSVENKSALNVGDWVTLDRQYAKEHGEGALNGDYKIVKKTVKARDLYTNGDSIYEFGYDPQPFKPKREYLD
jgi:hypothetical protein